MAYWFFSPYTVPDKKLSDLLYPERHEVGLHIATNAVKELETLQKKNWSPSKVLHFPWHPVGHCAVALET